LDQDARVSFSRGGIGFVESIASRDFSTLPSASYDLGVFIDLFSCLGDNLTGVSNSFLDLLDLGLITLYLYFVFSSSQGKFLNKNYAHFSLLRASS